MDVKDRIEAIEVKGLQKIEAVVAVKEAWKKDVDTYKEMRLLKKQDQQENFNRGKAMHKLYKDVLMQKVKHKYDKANEFKERIENVK